MSSAETKEQTILRRGTQMASIRYIDVKILKNGKVEIHVQGVKGKECIKLTENLFKKLGKVEFQELTNEYHQAEDNILRTEIDDRVKQGK